MKRNRRQSDGLGWQAFRRGVWTVLGAAVAAVAVFSGLMYWDYLDRQQAHLVDRIASLEREAAMKARPIIQIERASVYSMEGELVIETWPEGEEK